MNETVATTIEAYNERTETLAALGVSVLDPAETAKLAETPLGVHLLEELAQFAWETKGNDRRVRDAAAQLAKSATAAVEAVEANLRVPAGIDGGTWALHYAEKLQEAVAARQANVDRLVTTTWLARKALEV